MREFTYHGYQDDWEIKKMDSDYVLEVYFDFEIEGLDQDEMRVGFIQIKLDDENIPYFKFDDEYDYTPIKEEVEEYIRNTGIIEKAKDFVKTFDSIMKTKMKITKEKVHTENTRNGKKHYCSFQFEKANEFFTAIIQDKKINEIRRGRENVLDYDFKITTLLKHEKIVEHFYKMSNQRLKLLY